MPAARIPKIGARSHRLEVLRRLDADTSGNILIEVRCDCGVTKPLRASHFGRTKSCGCFRREMHNNAIVRYHEPGEAGLAALIANLRASAKSRGYEFTLEKSTIEHLTKQNCYYCGAAPSSVCRPSGNRNEARKQFSAYTYNGLDRMNNDLGYVPGNVVACCDYCNTAKNDQSYDEFIARLEAILTRHGRRIVS